jgi:phage terminase small subunit|nr:MAG TPA: terminase small subunit [Caudoviricetes sp.]
MIEKPRSIEKSAFKSQKWDEITKGRSFQASDIPAITLLCQWYEVVETCIDDITVDDGIQVAYANNIGDVKALPQLSTMKQASAEIRALNKQLGINDEVTSEQPKKRETPLNVIQTSRFSRAKNSRTA